MSNLTDPANIKFAVTHSMGSLITRYLIAQGKLPNINKMVMLGPPNHGSEIADFLRAYSFTNMLFKWIYGPAGQQLGTGADGFAQQLPALPSHIKLGIIAGNWTIDPISTYFLLPRPNDGKVSVASTHLDGENDHITLPCTHTFMMRNSAVIEQMLHFLVHGKFVE